MDSHTSGPSSLGWIAWFYFLTYTPYALVAKLVTTKPDPVLGRPLTGLELLPFTLIISSVLIGLFLWLTGWWREMPIRPVGVVLVPWPRRAMWVAGLGTAFLLISVPLSYTFPHVSIPTVQLLMRGDVLVVAPLVDLMSGRRVFWYSWAALLLVVAGLTINLTGGLALDFPPLLVTIVVLYTTGYFLRLAVMTKVAKTDSTRDLRRYFVEERVVSIPISIGTLGLIAWLSDGSQAQQLAWGFTEVWHSNAVPMLLVVSVALFLITIFAALILLAKHENSYCVPLERSASVLAGLVAVFILAAFFALPWPSIGEVTGAVLLVAAVCILAIGPKFNRP